MGTALHSTVGRHGDHGHLAVLVRDQKNHALAELCFQIISEVTKLVHIYAGYVCTEELHALDLDHGIHDVTECVLCLLALQRLILAAKLLHFLLKGLDVLLQGRRRCLHKLSGCEHLTLEIYVVRTNIVPGQRLDTTDTGSDTSLRQDLELADLQGVLHMRATAELGREIAHANDTHLGTVLLTEERHRTGLLRLFEGHDIGTNLETLLNLLVHHVLDLLKLFSRHRLEV